MSVANVRVTITSARAIAAMYTSGINKPRVFSFSHSRCGMRGAMSILDLSPDVFGIICRNLARNDIINVLSTCKTLNAVKYYGPLVIRPRLWEWLTLTSFIIKGVLEYRRTMSPFGFRRELFPYIECLWLSKYAYLRFDYLYVSVEVKPYKMVTFHLPTLLPRMMYVLVPTSVFPLSYGAVRVAWRRLPRNAGSIDANANQTGVFELKYCKYKK